MARGAETEEKRIVRDAAVAAATVSCNTHLDDIEALLEPRDLRILHKQLEADFGPVKIQQ